MEKIIKILIAVFIVSASYAQIPDDSQLEWLDDEFYLFCHFGPNTFTGMEWGEGTEKADIFNPGELDCEQWCRIAKQSGAAGIIITAKHHDGFCLWPSLYSSHTVKQSKWKNGNGDVLEELSQACRKNGLKFGVYISPWDRNHPEYGTPAYNRIFVNMMKEIFRNYGPIWELWWDGANGEGPNGKKQVYDWKLFENTVKKYSPQTIVFSDTGPGCRWVGNENGIAGTTNWCNLDTIGFGRGHGAPPADTLRSGNVNGRHFIPAECDVSIRPGWFYRESENNKIKTPEQLFSLYLKNVGRGANFNLNVPPDRRGKFSDEDSASLAGFKKLRDKAFANDLAKGALITGERTSVFAAGTVKHTESGQLSRQGDTAIWVLFNEPATINCIVLKEDLRGGQLIKKCELEFFSNKEPVKTINLTTIGHKRIVTFPEETISGIKITITDTKANPVISGIQVYKIPGELIEKE
ncbi:MAG: alpha-L-fucosidase [Deltaproteobacteria bacterium]